MIPKYCRYKSFENTGIWVLTPPVKKMQKHLKDHFSQPTVLNRRSNNIKNDIG